jgi:hypothetical protein
LNLVLKPVPEPKRRERCEAFLRLLEREGLDLSPYDRIRFLRTRRSTLPGELDRPPLSIEVHYELDLPLRDPA